MDAMNQANEIAKAAREKVMYPSNVIAYSFLKMDLESRVGIYRRAERTMAEIEEFAARINEATAALIADDETDVGHKLFANKMAEEVIGRKHVAREAVRFATVNLQNARTAFLLFVDLHGTPVQPK